MNGHGLTLSFLKTKPCFPKSGAARSYKECRSPITTNFLNSGESVACACEAALTVLPTTSVIIGSPAGVAELADAQDLGSCAERRRGSTPLSCIRTPIIRGFFVLIFLFRPHFPPRFVNAGDIHEQFFSRSPVVGGPICRSDIASTCGLESGRVPQKVTAFTNEPTPAAAIRTGGTTTANPTPPEARPLFHLVPVAERVGKFHCDPEPCDRLPRQCTPLIRGKSHIVA